MWELQSDYPNIYYRSKSGMLRNGTIMRNGSFPTTFSNILRIYFGVREVSARQLAKMIMNIGAININGTDETKDIKLFSQIFRMFCFS